MKRHKRQSRAKKYQRRQRRMRCELLEPRLPLAVDTWSIELSATGSVDLFGPNAGGDVQQMYEDNQGSDGNVISTSNVPGQNNGAPIAVDDAVSTDEDTVLNGDVLAANPTTVDSDPDGGPLTVTRVNGVAGVNIRRRGGRICAASRANGSIGLRLGVAG